MGLVWGDTKGQHGKLLLLHQLDKEQESSALESEGHRKEDGEDKRDHSIKSFKSGLNLTM